MSLPSEWEWLEEVSHGWEPPAELRGPTGVPKVDLAIAMLSCDRLGNDLIELVGELISEDARFTMWFVQEAKGRVESEKELALLSLVPEEQLEHVYEAWAAYMRADREAGGKVAEVQAERRGLEHALRRAIGRLAEVRSS